MSKTEDRYRILYELGMAFAAQTDLEELALTIVDRCRDIFQAEGISLLLHDPDHDQFYFPYVVSDRPEVAERLAEMRFGSDVGIAGEIFNTGKTIRVDDARSDPRVLQPGEIIPGQETFSMVGVPLRTRKGIAGVLEAVNPRSGGTFTDDDVELLEALAGTIGIAVENLQLTEALRSDRDRLASELAAERRQASHEEGFGQLIGESPAMRELFDLLGNAATIPISVLVYGETGTGKELAARALHQLSERAKLPFIAVNCAALPETLLESELFGHRKGSFTGAHQDRKGVFEAAHGGTIFLDEIGEMPLAMQPKLLRVLQEGEVVPVGDHRPRKVEVRVVSATNRDLEEEIRVGRFREDLYYRLATFPVVLPPLRERGGDVGLLASFLLDKVGKRYRRVPAGFSPAALERLEAYAWPGNVRELENEIERATAMVRDGDTIEEHHFSRRLLGPASTSVAPAISTTDLREARAAFEVGFIRRILEENKGNVTRTAEALGLSRVGLQKKMKELQIQAAD